MWPVQQYPQVCRLTTFLLDIHAGVETLDYMYGESISSLLRRLHSVLRMTILIYLPIDNIWESIFLDILASVHYSSSTAIMSMVIVKINPPKSRTTHTSSEKTTESCSLEMHNFDTFKSPYFYTEGGCSHLKSTDRSQGVLLVTCPPLRLAPGLSRNTRAGGGWKGAKNSSPHFSDSLSLLNRTHEAVSHSSSRFLCPNQEMGGISVRRAQPGAVESSFDWTCLPGTGRGKENWAEREITSQ